MKLAWRLVAGTLLVGTITLAAIQATESSLAQLADPLDLPQQLYRLQREFVRKDVLAEEHDELQQRVLAKEDIARAVLAGRLSLRDAAVQFHEVSQRAHFPWDHYAFTHPQWSFERRCCQYVIDTLESLLVESSRDRATLRALKAEVEKCQ